MLCPCSHRFRFLLTALTAAFAFSAPAQTQTSFFTTPVGFVASELTGHSDSIVSVPLNRRAEFVGRIAGASGDVLTLEGSAGLAANQFVFQPGAQPNAYYALVGTLEGGTNPKEGEMYPILANEPNTLTVALGGDQIDGIEAGTRVTVHAAPTLGSIFPAGDAGTSFAASGSLFFRKTEILLPNYEGSGINRSAASIYYFYNGAWRRVAHRSPPASMKLRCFRRGSSPSETEIPRPRR